MPEPSKPYFYPERADVDSPGYRRSFLRFIAQRAALGIATLWVVSLVTFITTNLAGIDLAEAALGVRVTPEQLTIFRKQQGADQTPVKRYWVWLKNVSTGDWGLSLVGRGQRVSDLVKPRIGRTFVLALFALTLALPLALFFGILGARNANGLADTILSAIILVVSTLPEFVVALAVLYLLGVWVGILPPNSNAVSYGTAKEQVEAYVLPALSLALVLVPYSSRMIRASAREVLASPYIRSALLRGVSESRLLARHVIPNILGPIANVVALSLAEILVGDVVIENVFGFPGLGQLAVSAVNTQDLAVVQATVIISASSFILLNVAADAAVVLLNPRLRRLGV
ncbi:MAG TPA: ABC transporter permease [Acidobacteriota bacterium]|jgi:peptide/nickel transport system permease protein